MTNITALANGLKQEVAWQVTPQELTTNDYVQFIIAAIKRMYVDTGRYEEFDRSKIQNVNREIFYETDLALDEETYVMLLAQINFFKKVQTDVNVMVSYSTDALSVTGGDKPYSHLKDTISELDRERRIVYYKMHRYAIG